LGMAAWNYFQQKNIKELRCEVYVENKASYNFIKSLGFQEYETKTYRMEDFHLDE
jgi:ribosomal protein S18 acetylase RimI-like enzyme